MSRRVSIVSAVLLAAAVSMGAQSDPRSIVAEAQRRTEVKSQRYEGLLQVLDSGGKVADKRWTFTRLGSHGRSKAVLRFVEPAEVKGVALLVVNHPDRASDQWMWTPALQRDRRIALQDRSTRFFGTDFSFEDLEERVAAQYDHALVGEEIIDGAPTWNIQATAKSSRSSQYSKQLLWIRKDNYATARIDSYVKDTVVRRLQASKIRAIQNVWTAQELVMSDLLRGTRTRLALDKIQYNLPFKDSDFTVQALRR
jgi:outer membrane lipoprotein-sorting protein